MKKLIWSFGLVAGILGCEDSNSRKSEVNRDAIITTVINEMNHQAEAWNSGDISGFMEAYWKSDSLVFVGSKGMTKGWDSTYYRYQKNYPNREKMGRLAFGRIEETFLDDSVLRVIGTWKLIRTEDTVGGYYTLHWMNKNNRWVIISDHTS